jgi:SOS response regulatory protein OraA/RecX
MQQRLPEHRDPIDLATRALARGDRTRRELDERLEQAGVGREEREAALETLERIGYVDDARVGHSRAEALAARGQGDEAIRFDLERRGLSAEAVEEALAALTAEAERARELAGRLGRTAKTAAQLRRKGFSEEALGAAFGDEIARMDV